MVDLMKKGDEKVVSIEKLSEDDAREDVGWNSNQVLTTNR